MPVGLPARDILMKTPVFLILFNRPRHTRKLLERLSEARPRHLYVIADGPRDDHPEDTALCAEARDLLGLIDWPCNLIRDFADVNLGCKRRVISGLTAGFERFDKAVILEDDCLPDPSFLRFSAELLDRYEDDPAVMNIAGTCMREAGPESYFFSNYFLCWGWATWRRAWHHYDEQLDELETSWPATKKTIPASRRAKRNYFNALKATKRGEMRSWAFQWNYTCLRRGGLTIVPSKRLIENTGFGADATHTVASGNYENLPSVGPLDFPLRHPPRVEINRKLTRDVFSFIYDNKPPLLQRWMHSIRKRIRLGVTEI
jgi:hypothetical protein